MRLVSGANVVCDYFVFSLVENAIIIGKIFQSFRIKGSFGDGRIFQRLLTNVVYWFFSVFRLQFYFIREWHMERTLKIGGMYIWIN